LRSSSHWLPVTPRAVILALPVTHTFTLGGDGSWDYIVPDPPNHRLSIARQNRMIVVEEDSGALLGEVTGIQGAHEPRWRMAQGMDSPLRVMTGL